LHVQVGPDLRAGRKSGQLEMPCLRNSRYLRAGVDETDRKEMADIIEDYHRELVPLIVPVTMLRHYVKKHNIEYLKDQYYLNPHPTELKLLNHV